MRKVFVIGGAALDITGRPAGVMRPRDSNIGRVRLSVGGVGHNIAKALARYDLAVELVTAMGSDFRTGMIERDCADFGIGLAHTLRADGPGATYLNILDEDGDMLTAINDMEIIGALTPTFLETKLAVLNTADMCVLDANLSAEALACLAERLTCPIFFEPVSCAKARRIGAHIGRCFAVKPNRFEAAHLSGCSCDTLRGVYRAADWFLEQGTKRVFISLAGEGIYWADADGCGHIPAEGAPVVDTTGAGDAMCAAIVYGCITGKSAEQCAADGNHESACVCARPRQEGV